MIEDFISRILLLALGYAYPAFLCFKTLEKNGVSIQELRFWCQYWTIVAVVTVLDKFTHIFISWLPMYRGMKLGLVIYLWHPNTKGSDYVYETMLRPYLLRYETQIDRTLFEAKERALNFAIYYCRDCTKLCSKWILQMFQFLVSQSAYIRRPASQLHDAQIPSLAPPPPSEILKRNISDKRLPPVPPSGPTTPRLSLTPSSESMKVRLHSQTQFVHSEDVAIDSDMDGRSRGKPDDAADDANKIKSH